MSNSTWAVLLAPTVIGLVRKRTLMPLGRLLELRTNLRSALELLVSVRVTGTPVCPDVPLIDWVVGVSVAWPVVLLTTTLKKLVICPLALVARIVITYVPGAWPAGTLITALKVALEPCVTEKGLGGVNCQPAGIFAEIVKAPVPSEPFVSEKVRIALLPGAMVGVPLVSVIWFVVCANTCVCQLLASRASSSGTTNAIVRLRI